MTANSTARIDEDSADTLARDPNYSFAYLDESTKRMLRRALLKAVAIPGYQVPFAQTIRRESGLTVTAVGLITDPLQAETIVASGQADMVALARGFLYDPRWGWHAAAELGGQVDAPPQYWRSQPSTQKALFGTTTFGAR